MQGIRVRIWSAGYAGEEWGAGYKGEDLECRVCR